MSVKKISNKKGVKVIDSRQVVLIRGPFVVPDTVYTTLPYVYTAQLNTGSQPYQDQIFRGNSIYDPDYSGAGGQPLGRDEWSNFYQNYRVHSSRISVSFASVSGGATQQDVAVVPNTDTSTYNTISRVFETPYETHGALTGVSAKGEITLRNRMTTARIFGVTDTAVEVDDQFRAAAGANPTNSWYWHVFTSDRGGSEANVYITVKINYFVEFYKRVNLAQS
jgi:hypothetical protein